MQNSKPLRYTIFILASALILSACDMENPLSQSNSDCGSKETQTVLRDIIKTETEKTLKDTDGMDISKARATLAQIKITVDNVRTTKQDPNSSKKFCTGRIKLSVPSELYANIEQAFALTKKQTTLKDLFQTDGFEVNANVISRDFDYSTQPTDDKKTLYVELEQAKPLVSAVGALLTLDQMKSKLEAKAIEEKAQETANMEARVATAKADYEKAQRENTEARKSINATWNAMPKEKKDEILADQKAWVAQKKAQCGSISDTKQSAELDFNNAEVISKEIHKFDCDTNMTNQRHELLLQTHMLRVRD
jgi:uncharacterized protein YecT (DUF1311 family)